MQSQHYASLNPIEAYLCKDKKDFTKQDIIKFITENEVRMVNFRYVAGDGRLKVLNFVIHTEDYLEDILSSGERVDGSSLFSFVEAGSSDLYVIPRYSSAFMDPFAEEPTISFLCSYFDKDGKPLESSPEYILKKAHKTFAEVTGGMEFHAMGELEFYIIGEKTENFQAVDQKGYHEASPFNKFEQFRCEAMRLIAQIGGEIKYGHSEVGNFTLDDKVFEQTEIEFLPVNVERAAEQILLGKWVLFNLANAYGLDLTFAPKITVGKAGSGMHIHTKIVKGNENMYVKDGELTEVAHKAIAGMLTLAPSLTAFGNTNPTSYFRLVPHQEAPTTVCWGDRNRSVLIRVPLGWNKKTDMLAMVNPSEKGTEKDFSKKQTIEFRCPDGSADVYLLLAGLVVAATHGFEMENAVEFAKNNYVSVNIHKDDVAATLTHLKHLPDSCMKSAEELENQKSIYSKHGVFSNFVLDSVIKRLRAYEDTNIRHAIQTDETLLQKMVDQYLYA